MGNHISTLPQHVAIIMDGNGRWAKQKGMDRIEGHKQGAHTVKNIIEYAAKKHIKYLSLFAFSLENWQRPKHEVDALMQLLIQSIEQQRDEIQKNNIRLLFLGNLQKLPADCQNSVYDIMEETHANNGMTVCVALSYSGKWDILQATRRLIEYCQMNKMTADQIDEQTFAKFLTTADIPDPDLLIRTSGETRISNFYLWQIAYCELYFTEKLWPEFTVDDFELALQYYASRERRFGKTSEQIQF